MDRLKIGMIGTGAITDLHYLAYKDNPKAELHSIADVDDEMLSKRANEWGVKNAYTDYKKLLEDPEIDAVEIIVPHHIPTEIAIAALKAGKHVSLQKPMAISTAECDAIIEAAKKSGKTLRVFENFMYYPPLVKAKELLDSGEIGEPLSIRIKCTQGVTGKDWQIPYRRWAWRFDPEKGGGGRVILDYGYHLFNVAMWLMGDVEKVYSWITHRTIQNNWVLDSPAVVIWKYKNAEKYGSYEVITSDDMIVHSKWKRPEDEWFEISGSKGFIWVNQCTSELLDSPPLVMYRDGVTSSFSVDADWGTSFIVGINDFFDAIKEGRQPPLTGETGKTVLQFCQAIERSAKEGREVKLDEMG
jgi:predicted dehydrogenase